MTTVLKNGNALVNGAIEKKTIVLKDGKIAGIFPADSNLTISAEEVVDCENLYVFPGFIDLHIHGSGGGESQSISEESYNLITSSQVRFGVTSILLTFIGASIEELIKAVGLIPLINDVRQGARILGMHLEGPWISPKKIGYLDRSLFEFDIDLSNVKKVIEMCGGQLKIVTLAPELDGADQLIKELSKNGIVASCGHTEAGYEVVKRSISYGIKSFTHLWNMSGPIQSREPGVVGCALSEDTYVEIVADGFHVHPENVAMTIRLKTKDKVCLVTDAMIATGTSLKSYSFMGVDGIQVINGRTCGPNNAIIGSVLTLDKAVRNVLSWTDATIPEVIGMVTENPAKLLGIFPKKGIIQEGADADIAIFNKELICQSTYVAGQISYRK